MAIRLSEEQDLKCYVLGGNHFGENRMHSCSGAKAAIPGGVGTKV
jgi:hypothetical protein